MLSSVKPQPHNFLQSQAKIFILKCLPAPVSQQTRNIVTSLIPNTAKNNMENAIMGGYFIKILTSSFLFIWYVDLFTFARDELNINITWLIYSLLSIKIFYEQCSAKQQYSTPWQSLIPSKEIISANIKRQRGMLPDSLYLIEPITLSISKQKYPLTR